MQTRNFAAAALTLTLAATSPASASPSPNLADVRIMVEQHNMHGFIDGTGKLVIPFWFGNADDFHNGIGCGDHQYIDMAGRRLLARALTGGNCLNGGVLVPVPSSEYGQPVGLMDRTGKITWMPPDVTSVDGLYDGLAAAYSSSIGLWGFVDATGAWAIKPQFGTPPTDDERKRFAHCDELLKEKYPDRGTLEQCSIVAYNRTFDARHFDDGLAPVQVGAHWGVIDKSGKMVLAPQWAYVEGFRTGHSIVRLDNGSYQYIDKTGKPSPAGSFKDANSFLEGLAIVDDGTSTHFIDTAGKTPPLTSPAGAVIQGAFADGRALAQQDGRTVGYLDKTGAWAIQPRFWHGYQFKNGFARVDLMDGRNQNSSYVAIIDTAGKPLWIEEGGKAAFDRFASWKVGDPWPKKLEPVPDAPEKLAGKTPAGRYVIDPTDKEAVLDTQTGLEWAAHDNGKDVILDEAWDYARAYRGGGHTDWRIPADYELDTMVAKDLAHKEPGDCTGGKSYYLITPLIHLSCGIAWSSSTHGAGDPVAYGFISGNARTPASSRESTNYRALLVRNY